MNWSRTLATLALGATLAVSAFAQAADPAAALKEINEYRSKEIAAAREAQRAIDVTALSAKTKAMAEEAVKGVNVANIDGKQGLEWAQLFQMAGQHKNACDAASKFLDTKPDPAKAYSAHSLMLTSCNQLGEGMMLMQLLKAIQPTNDMQLMGLASSTAMMYSDTIRSTMGLNSALETLDMMEQRLAGANPADDQGKARQRSTKAAIVQARAEMLDEAGRKAEAKAALDKGIADLGAAAPEARGLSSLKKRMEMVGVAAPAIAIERGYGNFAGLDSAKGKVVMLDFFAHWCGPCIRAFPDMKKMYADFKPQGFEIVGVTTYYGYYKTESREKRDMPRDTEFAKMQDFINEHSLPWPVVYGERSNFEAYGVTGIPHVALVDRNGILRKIKIGYSPESFAEFRKEVEKMLAEK